MSELDGVTRCASRDGYDGWKQHFAQDVAEHQEDIVCRLRDHFAKAK